MARLAGAEERYLITEVKGADRKNLAEVNKAAAERWYAATNAMREFGHWVCLLAYKVGRHRRMAGWHAGAQCIRRRRGPTRDGARDRHAVPGGDPRALTMARMGQLYGVTMQERGGVPAAVGRSGRRGRYGGAGADGGGVGPHAVRCRAAQLSRRTGNSFRAGGLRSFGHFYEADHV